MIGLVFVNELLPTAVTLYVVQALTLFSSSPMRVLCQCLPPNRLNLSERLSCFSFVTHCTPALSYCHRRQTEDETLRPGPDGSHEMCRGLGLTWILADRPNTDRIRPCFKTPPHISPPHESRIRCIRAAR